MEVRALLDDAFRGGEDGDFSDDDWAHMAAGDLFLLADGPGPVLGVAAVAERRLEVAGTPLRTGYVEGMAIRPDHQRRGLGTRLMREVGSWISTGYELGALATGVHAFYESLGWRTWRGPTSVRMPDGSTVPTPDEDGYILVLPTPASPPLRLADPISCEWRAGDAW